MKDPFAALHKSLESVFHLEIKRQGKYVYPEIQHLKNAIENYKPDGKETFINLLKSLRAALHRIEKWGIDFNSIKKPIDELAKIHQAPPINWDKFLSHPKVSPRFQFNALNNTKESTELIPWLTHQSEKKFTQYTPSVQTSMLIEHGELPGFSQKLSGHLKRDPGFLSGLILESENNFIRISHTRLILYLTDEQIAKAIIKYIPKWVQTDENPLTQVEQLVEKLNGILSNGRSITTLLRNTEAKSILDKSELFQIYQGDEYKNHPEQFPSSEEEGNRKSI